MEFQVTVRRGIGCGVTVCTTPDALWQAITRGSANAESEITVERIYAPEMQSEVDDATLVSERL